MLQTLPPQVQTIWRQSILSVSAAAISLICVTSAADWPYWRGTHFDGIAADTGLPDNWNPEGGEGSHLIWKNESLGGRCTPTAMDGRLYLILRAEPETPREGERVVCVDAASGEVLWENRFNVWNSDVPDTRVGWASVVCDPETGNVYALGVSGFFTCMDGKTGETVWSNPLHEQMGLLSTYGGRTNFPIIFEDLVIVSGVVINFGEKARPNHRFIGFDKRTGKIRWFNGTTDLPEDTTYSGPSIVTVEGQSQLIVGAGDGRVWSFQPRTGKALWSYALSQRGLFATPLAVGNRVFAGHSEENLVGTSMGALAGLEITGAGAETKVNERWIIKELVAGRSAPTLVDDRVYLIDDRCKLYVIDANSGEFIQERVSLGDSRQWGSPLVADGKMYILTENGRWAVGVFTEEGVEIVNRGRIRNETFIGSPIAAGGRLYFPGVHALYCVGTEQGQGGSRTPLDSAEKPAEENPSPSLVQISPAEKIIGPGDSIDFEVRLFNELGQQVPLTDPVTFAISGGGQMSGNTYTSPIDAVHRAVTVTATVGKISGTTRLRSLPPLPWKFDFDGLDDAPLTWVGARYRHVIRTIDGSPALVKVTTIPKGARSQAFMGPSNLSDYTIQADVKGERKDNKLPDIGIIAQGYVMAMQGESQQLQIRSWAPQLRMATTIDFPWREETWYQMKLKAETAEENGKKVALLWGKVWQRGQPEPKEWTITARDESPNLSGAPGLFGDAKSAELYLDNVMVYANQGS